MRRTQMKRILPYALSACLVYLVVLCITLLLSPRPPFSNEFGFRYGPLPLVPGWSRVPTYYDSRSGDRVYVDRIYNTVLLVKDNADPEREVLGSPIRSNGKVQVLFSTTKGRNVWVQLDE